MSSWKTVQVDSVLMQPSGKLRAFRVVCDDYQLGEGLSQIGRTLHLGPSSTSENIGRVSFSVFILTFKYK